MRKNKLVEKGIWDHLVQKKIRKRLANFSPQGWGELLYEFSEGYWCGRKVASKVESGDLDEDYSEDPDRRKLGMSLFRSIELSKNTNLNLARFELLSRCRLWLFACPSTAMFNDVSLLCSKAGFEFLPGRIVFVKIKPEFWKNDDAEQTSKRIYTISLKSLVAAEGSKEWFNEYSTKPVLSANLLKRLFKFKSYTALCGEFIARESCIIIPVAILEGRQCLLNEPLITRRIKKLMPPRDVDYFYPYSADLRRIFSAERNKHLNHILDRNDPQKKTFDFENSKFLDDCLPDMFECFQKNKNQGICLTKLLGTFDLSIGRYRKRRPYKKKF